MNCFCCSSGISAQLNYFFSFSLAATGAKLQNYDCVRVQASRSRDHDWLAQSRRECQFSSSPRRKFWKSESKHQKTISSTCRSCGNGQETCWWQTPGDIDASRAVKDQVKLVHTEVLPPQCHSWWQELRDAMPTLTLVTMKETAVVLIPGK